MYSAKHKFSNWQHYNQALVNRGSLCMDDYVICQWYCQSHHGRGVRGFQFIDNPITTSWMLKIVFMPPLCALEGFIYSHFRLLNEPLKFPYYSCISKRTKTVLVRYQLPGQRPIAHLVIDCTGMKVLGEGEWKWKTRKHAKEKCRN